MALNAVLKRPNDATFTGGTAQADYATYIKAAADEYVMNLGTVTITIASPAVITLQDHNLVRGDRVTFSTTGALPTGITAGTNYWVSGVTDKTFTIATSLSNAFAGTSVNTSGTQSGVHSVSFPAWRTAEMISMLNFIPRASVTKVFCPRSGGANVNTGYWSLAANWYPNGVPTTDDKVLIGPGVTCVYDIASSPDIYWIRSDGRFQWDISSDRHLLVDTIVTTPTGQYWCGDEATPVAPSITMNCEFSASRGWINVAQDTMKQSRGYAFMSQALDGGYVWMHGAEKTHAIRVQSHTGPLAGATTAVMESAPNGWRVGDRIQFAATSLHNSESIYETYDHSRNDGTFYFDEDVVTITAISGATVSFTPALKFNHNAPISLWGDQQPKCWVRNLTRNVKFSTKDWATVDMQQRAHSMYMHTHAFDQRWVEHRELGRTAKIAYNGFTMGGAVGPPGLNITAGVAAPMVGRFVSGGVATFPCEGIIKFQYFASSYPATLTVVGTNGLGNSQTCTLTFSASDVRSGGTSNANYIPAGTTEPVLDLPFKTITSITGDKTGSIIGQWVGRSFRITGSGVRNTQGKGNGDAEAPYWTFFAVDAATNVQGRYAWHIHRAGVGYSAMKENATVIGCVVDGSPGWGFAQHQSHCTFDMNVSHRTGGAGFITERGDETGMMRRNHASCVQAGAGQDVIQKGEPDYPWGDPGNGSNGFQWRGRAPKCDGNVSDCSEGAYFYGIRSGEGAKESYHQFDHPEILYGAPDAPLDHMPLQLVIGNESFACGMGFGVSKSQPLQFHDTRSIIEDQFIWSCHRGIQTEYTAHYTLVRPTFIHGFTLSARDYQAYTFGMSADTLTTDWNLIRPRVDGATQGWNKSGVAVGSGAAAGYAGQNIAAEATENGIEVNHFSAAGPLYHARNARWMVDVDVQRCKNTYRDLQNFDVIMASSSYASLVNKLTLDVSSWHPTPKYIGPRYGMSGYWPEGDPDQAYTLSYGFRIQDKLQGGITRTDRLGGGTLPQGWHGGGSADYSGLINDNVARHAAQDGSYLDTDGNYYVFMDVLVGDRIDGEIFRYVVPCRVSGYQFGGGTINFAPYRRSPDSTVANTTRPSATNRSVTCTKNTNLDIDMLVGVTHPNSRICFFRGNTAPRYGFTVRNGYNKSSRASGIITYVPPKGWTGTDTIKYWIMDQDGNLQSEVGNTITITVQDTAPTFQPNPDGVTTAYNTQVVFNVLNNDQGPSLTLLNAVINSGGGTINSFNADGTITYTPANNYSGYVFGTATVKSTSLNQQADVGFTIYVRPQGVAPSNAVPTVQNQTVYCFPGKQYTVDLLKGAVDPDGGQLIVTQRNPTAGVDFIAPGLAGITTFSVSGANQEINFTAMNPALNEVSGKLTIVAVTKGRRFGKR